MPALIGYVDTRGCYRLNNRAYETWFGHRREEVTGRHLGEVLRPAAWEKALPRMERALAGEVVQYENLVPYAAAARGGCAAVTRRTATGRAGCGAS